MYEWQRAGTVRTGARAARVVALVGVLALVGYWRWSLQGGTMPDHAVESHYVEDPVSHTLNYAYLAALHGSLLLMPYRL